MCSRSKFLMLSVFLLLLLTFPVPWLAASSEDASTVALTEAEEILGLTYEAVLEAEEAGANVSGLLGRLDLGGEYLAEAYVLVRLGDSENADRLAGLCVEVVEDVRSEAFELRDEMNRSGESDRFMTMVGSVVGVIAVVVISFLVWRVFKQRYCKSVLELRPEVVSGES